MFPLIFFLREFFSCALLSERLEKTGYLAILVYFSITQTALGYLVMRTQSNCIYVYVVVNFLFQVIFIFLLFLEMVIYANEVETKEK